MSLRRTWSWISPPWSFLRIFQILESPISEEEIKKAIWTLHLDKAPGPDGFPIRFYRMCWNIIKKDLLHLISWMSKGKMGGATNSTFLALIPKEPILLQSKDLGQSPYVMPRIKYFPKSYPLDLRQSSLPWSLPIKEVSSQVAISVIISFWCKKLFIQVQRRVKRVWPLILI